MRAKASFLVVGIMLTGIGCNAILGIDDHSLASSGTPDTDAGTPTLGSDAGVPDADQDGATPAPADAGPDAPAVDAGCTPFCAGSTPVCYQNQCFECMPTTLSCSGATPRSCDQNGTWKDGTACSGATPICTSGVCGKYRLTGGLTSTAPPSGSHTVKLVSGGFERGGRTCSPTNICVTGGIVP